ncbi:MAG TPA: hypothetical protein VH679_14760 [Vicinamibacterales bacterium]
MTPVELALEIRPRARLDVIDIRARAAEVFGAALSSHARCLYLSRHTTAGFLPQSLAARLSARPQAIEPYLDVFRAVFPEGAGYLHDQLHLRHELAPSERAVEPANADSHLTFIGGGLLSSVSSNARRPGAVYFVDLDGTNQGQPRRRVTTLIGYDHEEEVASTTFDVPVSSHPIDAVNLRDGRLGIYEQLTSFIERHGVAKGRVRLELDRTEQHASLTVNEYETLLMRHDLAEVLHNPLRFAAEKARHAWNDPFAVPTKALGYAQYDLVRALNRLVEALGLEASRIERILARTLEGPASRFLRMRRSVDLVVSDSNQARPGAIIEGTYQTPILLQWRPARGAVRRVSVRLTRLR